MAFKMNGWSAFKDEPTKKKSAQFMSYDDLINSAQYKRASNSKEYKALTYWTTTSNCPDCPEYKAVNTVELNPKMNPNKNKKKHGV